jgi:hypothetical protein
MLKELILSILIATPLGLTMVIGILWLIREAWRWHRMWHQAREEAFDDDDDLPEIEGEEVVYR